MSKWNWNHYILIPIQTIFNVHVFPFEWTREHLSFQQIDSIESQINLKLYVS